MTGCWAILKIFHSCQELVLKQIIRIKSIVFKHVGVSPVLMFWGSFLENITEIWDPWLMISVLWEMDQR